MLFKLAFVLATICAVSGQILPPSGFRRVRPGPTVWTTSGPYQGQEETYDIFRRINTYKGIRYAQAPVGNLRFRQPFPVPPHFETRQAWEYGSECPQFSLLLNRLTGDEDCLFLNIATPTNIRSRLPVVVNIHGGGLQMGNGEMGLLGPEFINQENVIFVSFNYRLNVLGFLNTLDMHSPGNYGIKDMILVLRWVQDNIEFFGGNRNDVTIMGISGGAVAVQALVVTPVASGLFHKALSHSGSLLNSWGFNRSPLNSVQMLVNNLQLQVTDSADLLTQLRATSVERLLGAAGLLFEESAALNELTFMPSIDPFDTPEARIFTAPIPFMIRNGNINTVPYMIGFNSAESMIAISEVRNNPTILERFNQNPHLLIPPEWNLLPNSPYANEVITAFRALYFQGAQNITVDMAESWSDYVSDRSFIFGVSKAARLHRARQQVFYFRFSYSGALSFAQRIRGLTDYSGAMHGDDGFYLFRLNVLVTPVAPGNEAFDIQRRYIRMWTNFFKYAHPTPSAIDPMIPVTWPEMGISDDFMDIGRDLTADNYPFSPRMSLWHFFDGRFNQ